MPQTHVICHMLDTGHCLAHERMMLRGGSARQIECHALVALIQHPEHGWGLWDTGYAPRMLTETSHWPFSLYRRATPLRLRPELALVEQLPRWGVSAGDIGWIVLSHLHADHVAGLRDFPQARLILTAAAYADVRGRRGWRALSRACIPSLLPDDFAQRATLISAFPDQPLPALGPTYDVFGDGALRLVALPGHAHGQVGMLVQTAERAILLAADGAWLTRAIRELRPPSPLTYLFIDDRRAVRETLRRLHDFARQQPEVALIPTHCPEAYAREVLA
jgi:glyoxylase-like metal-dependent hydrolase (beta-lactamase superfamily II)